MSGKPIDITGQKFGRLMAVSLVGKSRNNGAIWLCKCDCGNVTSACGPSLRNGNTKSCGCLKRDVARDFNYKHGMARTYIYHAWHSMQQRCFDPKCKAYPYYGGRGIGVCKRWRTLRLFVKDILAIIGPRPGPGYSLDRINNDGDYDPENVRWATMKQQSNNRRKRRLDPGVRASVVTVERSRKGVRLIYEE